MVDEKMEDRRVFTVNGIDYFIAQPSAANVRDAEWHYSVTYSKCLRKDIPTTAEMRDLLIRKNIMGDTFNKRNQELIDIFNTKLELLNSTDDLDEKQLLAYEVAQARDDLFQWEQRVNGPMANTCERISDDSRIDYLTACIVQNQDGSLVWDSYEDYLVEGNRELSNDARYEVTLFLRGLDSNFLDNVPEAVAIREVEQAKADMLAKENEVKSEIIEDATTSDSNKSKAVKKKKSK